MAACATSLARVIFLWRKRTVGGLFLILKDIRTAVASQMDVVTLFFLLVS
jgi:hypothetical protein